MIGDWLGPSCLDLRTIPKGHPSSRTPLQGSGGPCRSTPPSAQFWSSHFLVDGSGTTGQLTIPIQLSNLSGHSSNKQFSSLQFLHLQYVVISIICIMGRETGETYVLDTVLYNTWHIVII